MGLENAGEIAAGPEGHVYALASYEGNWDNNIFKYAGDNEWF